MKIPFVKLNAVDYPFKLDLDNIVFEGSIKKKNQKLAQISANLKGFIYRHCDRCGEEMELQINENIKIQVSDGIFKDENNTLSDTVEFFDSHIDLIELAHSELQSYLSDYFYCDKCL
ncbi:hypothetical protein [Campylobacter insulaenigrae]|uniref:DUF177 domain-containing protein n=1 Tax=Campylobacter insulaenigrae TaxID=260714 RepID=A0ABY3G690_9BACT|nr:hypothetical protein [Campylobacter insulaenigrae]MCR6571225.1 hypothetical protein [Campylobacter insulaenigrae]MCR6573007.1 hypothetical protein [Campylobacter insulaenigrae]MCR6574349.1 hypothetical protein [Campylobacter insulaenigrae]MCR6580624.1 hypothetical protein [Campylobacter insulaenigrae]MCR6582129.1 hypothetical protein [Campylobacter insulaenigrae]